MKRGVKGVVIAGALLVVLGVPAAAAMAERALTVDEAIALALKKNESILIVREGAAAAVAAVSGAKGAYNPLLELGGSWGRNKVPVNSAFSGAPAGEGAPTVKTVEGSAVLSQYLPTGGAVSLRALSSRGTTDGTFGLLSPAYQTQVGVELRQPLLRDRAVDPERLTIRVARADEKRSLAEVRLEVTETIAAVERAYWTLAAARAEISVREEAVRLAEEQLAETQERVTSGVAPETEAAQPRAEVERRRGELLAAREAGSRADTALKLLILSDADDELWADAFAPDLERGVDVTTVDRNTAMQQALASRPELAIASAALERRTAERVFAGNRTHPTLDAVVSYDRFGLSGSANPAAAGPSVVIPFDYDGGWGRSWEMLGDGDFDDVRAGLVFSFPIGNDAAQAGAAIARHTERQVEAEMVRARKSVRADVLDAAAALETAGQRIEAARAGREAAEIQLSAEQDRYDAGMSTNFLVLTRQNDLSHARLEEISAQADYRVARTELARATGSLLEQHGVDLDDATH